jgi:pyruvate/2-oxoglutarate dehydrogenase complex dihydrolipoamide dehydrogenase (E3) component
VNYDINIIGAGPGGYVMAERAGEVIREVMFEF